MSGLDLAAHLLQRRPPIKVILLTLHKTERIFNAAIDLGVEGYVLKDEAEAGIVESIRTVARGGVYFTPSLSAFLMRRRRQAARVEQAAPGLESLTPMERSVLRRIAVNKTSREIGAELFISHRTVETHRANICAKLNLHGSHPLLQFALENKSALLSLPDR
jgi:DNA-binding NarL/FixJ family response regulator